MTEDGTEAADEGHDKDGPHYLVKHEKPNRAIRRQVKGTLKRRMRRGMRRARLEAERAKA
jgi:hypothetical protein